MNLSVIRNVLGNINDNTTKRKVSLEVRGLIRVGFYGSVHVNSDETDLCFGENDYDPCNGSVALEDITEFELVEDCMIPNEMILYITVEK